MVRALGMYEMYNGGCSLDVAVMVVSGDALLGTAWGTVTTHVFVSQSTKI